MGKTDNTLENINQIIKAICNIDCPEDAVKFYSDSVVCAVIQEQNEYHGIRAYFSGELAKTRSRMQIDIGFGDTIFPQPQHLKYPTLLNMPSPSILGYTPETLIAEKLHAMIKLGTRNSRIKDYFDVWFLSHQFPFEGHQLSTAIQQTFLTRKMDISDLELQIFDVISQDKVKQQQWQSFIDKNQLSITSTLFSEVAEQIKLFIHPLAEAYKKSNDFNLHWKPPGPWK